MVTEIRSMGLSGIRGYGVTIECALSGGLPAIDVVGLPDTAVREARERVRSAIKANGLKFPASRITINLAPAWAKKEGTLYDLPILLAILTAAGDIKPIEKGSAFVGELSLGGELRPVRGALSMALAAEREGIKKLFLPEENAPEAAFAENVEVYPVTDVAQLLAHLRGEEEIPPARPRVYEPCEEFGVDFSQVVGQENVKRALEIAAAGGHNVLMSGSPGSGKSLLAKRIPSILPAMSREEALETTEIHSIVGLTDRDMPIINMRPFRAPHHTVSPTAISGGGSRPKPGEASLAHNGVLFLDELPEFHKDALEVLRQPMEDGQITISRVAGAETYPCRFMLVCAMNPCKCGWYGHPSGRCTCSENAVKQYRSRISGPMLDRIDIFIDVPSVEFSALSQRPDSETSGDIRARVNAARRLQEERYEGTGVHCNAHMTGEQIKKYCALDDRGTALMKGAFDRLGLTARSFDKILKVARTIADMDGSENIQMQHLAEAIQYKSAIK